MSRTLHQYTYGTYTYLKNGIGTPPINTNAMAQQTTSKKPYPSKKHRARYSLHRPKTKPSEAKRNDAIITLDHRLMRSEMSPIKA